MSEQKPKRRARVASDTAHSWARNLRLKNPYAKMVLLMLTGHVSYVNEICSCFVGIETLAEDTELSPDTVRKRLAWLEKIGAIVRFPRWIDPNGRVNGEGRGKRTTDDIRLLIDADADEIEARANGHFEAENDSESTACSPSPQQGLNPLPGDGQDEGLPTASPPVSPLVAPCQPSDSGKGLDSSEPESSNLKDSPPTPSLPNGEISSESSESEDRDNTIDLDFEKLQRSYPKISNRPDLCRQLLSALSVDERDLAQRAACGARIAKDRDKYQPIVMLEKFLRTPDCWLSFAALVPLTSKPSTAVPDHWIAEDSVELRALNIACAIARRNPPIPIHQVGVGPWSQGKRVVRVSGDIPTGAETFAALADDGVRISTTDWKIVENGTQQFFAWCDRVAEWIGRRPDSYRIWLDQDGNVVPSAADAYREPREGVPEKWLTPKCKEGLLVPPTPNGWPPPKGDSAPSQFSKTG